MGREWLYWGIPRRRSALNKQDDHTTSAGCMCAVFQLFDLHHLNHHQHSLSPSPFIEEKGVEAPRNSLELDEPPAINIKQQQQQNLNFPAGIQIKTRDSISRKEDEWSMDSPSTKTPNLVARLMGLDLLPESSSPSFSCPNSKPPTNSHSHSHLTLTHQTNRCFYDDDINVGARSLPETPRISSARRSDVEYHHRLSLQINKENNNTNDDFKTTRHRFRHQHQDENRSPGHYAKQILKQVKESVSRRVGLDITNTTRDELRRDQNLLIKLSKKNETKHQSTTSPKLRILDTNTSPRNSASSDANPPKPKPQSVNQHHPHKENSKMGVPKSCDQAIRKKKEEAFVRSSPASEKKSRKAPLSSELVHLGGPTVLAVKKGPSPPATKLPQKQQQPQVSDALSSKRNTQLSSNTCRSYNQQPDKIFTAPENAVPDSGNGCAAAEYRCYIQKILKRSGIIDKLTPLTLGKWHTPSHPLDPSIFYYLELFHPASTPSAAVLSHRCNRKLIFQLVDEILADILKPHLDYKPWITNRSPGADELGLVDDLCERIGDFPGKECEVLEDIDFLIEKDLSAAVKGYIWEEGERLVREVEAEIVEQLVSEMVADGVRTETQMRWLPRHQMP